MSIQRRVFLVLLLLSMLLGTSIIIPGYLKIRQFESMEAQEYAQDKTKRMVEKIQQRVGILEKAGVAEIESYVEQSKQDLLTEFSTAEPDSRVRLYIVETGGRILHETDQPPHLPIESALLQQINNTPDHQLWYKLQDQYWMTTVARYDSWDWHLISMMSEHQVYRESKQYLNYVIGISAVVLLLILSLFAILTRGLRYGTNTILEQLEQIGTGRYDLRLDVTGPGELGILQKSVNTMIDKIELEIMTRKSVEQDLSNAKQEAEKVSNIKVDQFVELSKQSRTSINSVCGFAELLRKTPLDERQRAYVSNILKANQQMMGLIAEMFELSGIKPAQASSCCTAESTPLSDYSLLKGIEVDLLELDPLSRDFVTEILKAHLLRVVDTHPATAKGKRARKRESDLVILDDQRAAKSVPGRTDFIRKHVLAYHSETPILVMTSETDPEINMLYKNAGATAYISKPFSAADLLDKISELLIEL